MGVTRSDLGVRTWRPCLLYIITRYPNNKLITFIDIVLYFSLNKAYLNNNKNDFIDQRFLILRVQLRYSIKLDHLQIIDIIIICLLNFLFDNQLENYY